MKVLVDLNVILDVVQEREPWYRASAGALSALMERPGSACLPCHMVTTLFYVVRKHASRQVTEQVIDWLLGNFVILAESRELFLRARSLDLPDFEDAVCASAAEATGCVGIVTRNLKDFEGSPVPAMLPEELLDSLILED